MKASKTTAPDAFACSPAAMAAGRVWVVRWKPASKSRALERVPLARAASGAAVRWAVAPQMVAWGWPPRDCT
jgi:hypothetical protein